MENLNLIIYRDLTGHGGSMEVESTVDMEVYCTYL